MQTNTRDQTIKDFGDQWTKYTDNDGFYGSLELFRDYISPILQPEDFGDKNVIDIGSGTGRIVQMLLDSGAKHVTAVEPSEAFVVLKENTKSEKGHVSLLRLRGDQLTSRDEYDFATSVGVLHHIPNPNPVVKAMYNALIPGGKCYIWLYGKEGNNLYLALALPIRIVTKRLPHIVLTAFVWILYFFLVMYIQLSRFLPLPLRDYMLRVIRPLTPQKRRVVIYDQLNPTYAKYYTHGEAFQLMSEAGFQDIQLHHRHGYSWSVLGTKPKG